MNNGMSDFMGDGYLRIIVDGKGIDDMWYAADTSEIKEHGYNVAKFLFNLVENGIINDFCVKAFKCGNPDIIATFTSESIEEEDGYTQWYT